VFIFLLLQPIIIPLRYFESFVTWILFKILMRTKFIQISTRAQTVEVPYL